MHIIFLKALLSTVISFLLSYYLVPIFCAIALKWDVLDVPDGKIKKHDRPIPYLGGIAVYVAFICTLAFNSVLNLEIFPFILGITLLLFLGLIDDLLKIKPYQKFFGQFFVGLCFVKSGLFLKENFFLNNMWSIPISLLWVITIINAFNLVDVMDGLAVTIAIWTTGSFLVLAYVLNQYQIIVLLASFMGALLAFLWYNKPPAKIYLGDAGSLFIGGFLSVIPFLFKWSIYNWCAFFAPVVILAIPLLEIAILILVRSYKKVPFYCASPDHFSIYLMKAGWTKKQILSFVSIFSILLLFVALLLSFNKIDLFQLITLGIVGFTLWSLMLNYYCNLSYSK